ncbi:hypothetical protein PO124_04200 [Bacillus licheniformis]|nr:hypothetical protein [Bacillus licheniformis]
MKEGIQIRTCTMYRASRSSTKTSPYNDFSRLKRELDDFIENGLARTAVEELLDEGKNCVKPSFSSAVHCTVPLKKGSGAKRVAKLIKRLWLRLKKQRRGHQSFK